MDESKHEQQTLNEARRRYMLYGNYELKIVEPAECLQGARTNERAHF